MRVQQVVAADLLVESLSDTCKLPPRLPKKAKAELAKLKPIRLEARAHDELLDEINRREVLEHEEEVACSSDESSSEEQSSDEEESSDHDSEPE